MPHNTDPIKARLVAVPNPQHSSPPLPYHHYHHPLIYSTSHLHHHPVHPQHYDTYQPHHTEKFHPPLSPSTAVSNSSSDNSDVEQTIKRPKSTTIAISQEDYDHLKKLMKKGPNNQHKSPLKSHSPPPLPPAHGSSFPAPPKASFPSPPHLPLYHHLSSFLPPPGFPAASFPLHSEVPAHFPPQPFPPTSYPLHAHHLLNQQPHLPSHLHHHPSTKSPSPLPPLGPPHDHHHFPPSPSFVPVPPPQHTSPADQPQKLSPDTAHTPSLEHQASLLQHQPAPHHIGDIENPLYHRTIPEHPAAIPTSPALAAPIPAPFNPPPMKLPQARWATPEIMWRSRREREKERSKRLERRRDKGRERSREPNRSRERVKLHVQTMSERRQEHMGGRRVSSRSRGRGLSRGCLGWRQERGGLREVGRQESSRMEREKEKEKEEVYKRETARREGVRRDGRDGLDGRDSEEDKRRRRRKMSIPTAPPVPPLLGVGVKGEELLNVLEQLSKVLGGIKLS